MEKKLEQVMDAIESHLDWACEYNNGVLIADDLADTLRQIFRTLPPDTEEG